MNDASIMPFGKYKGKALEDIPASYFHWLWHNLPVDDNKELFDYMNKSMVSLKRENKDLVWDKKQL